MRKIINSLLLLTLLGVSKPVVAQIDTVFWFAAPWITTGHAGNTPIVMRISTFSQATTVRVQQPAGTYDTTFTIAANSLFSKFLSHIVNQVENTPANVVHNRGLKITSDYPITIVYEIVTSGNNPETFSLKGQNGMGYEFVCPFQTQRYNWAFSPVAKSQIDVVATENNTVVWITPKCNVVGHAANVTYSISLNAGQSYNIENVTNNTNVPGQNLSGTIVVADKPISVTVTDDSVRGVSGCMDALGDQIVPVEVVGMNYIINKGGLYSGETEGAYIVATENFTQVNIDDGVVTTVLLNKGDTYYYHILNPLTYITGDKSIYVIHVSGFGCEMGEAIIPPLNCAGSEQISFTRTNSQTFILNVLCKTSATGNFLLNGNATLVPASAFTVVPGTSGLWSGAQITYNTTQIPVGVTNLLRNTHPVDSIFSMGVINGGAGTGCYYHYMSSFLRRVYTNAGADQNICTATTQTISLTGTVDGGAVSGVWTTPNGSGTFANPNSLSTTYTLSPTDLTLPQVQFVLSSVGNCKPVRDTMVLKIYESPTVDAGLNQTFCKNNITTAPLNGTLLMAAGSNWTTLGSGSFGNPGALNTTYLPSPADLSSGNVKIYLTSTGSLNGCPNKKDSVMLYFTPSPTVAISPVTSMCANNATIVISGTVTGGATTGLWSGGLGSYNPGTTSLTNTYVPTPAEIATGSVNIVLASTNNGNCKQVKDSIQISFTPAPVVSPGSNILTCRNNPSSVLSGTVSGPTTTGIWSGGSGTFNPNNTTLNAVYIPTPAELAAGSVTLTLTSTANGNCNQEQNSMVINFTNPASVNAGTNLSICKNNPVPVVTGSISGPTTTGIWTGGTGLFSPNNTALTATYTPSPAEIASGTATLVLTSTNNGNCNQVTDTVLVNFTNPPAVNAGIDLSICKNNIGSVISGTVSGPTTTGNWTGGAGTFNPGSTALTSTYTPTAAEIAAGSVTLTLVSTNNGNCNQEQDQMIISFTNPPTVSAGSDIVSCKNNPNVNLNGTVGGITITGLWSGGTGTYTPGNTSLNSLYSPSAAEVAAGSTTLILTSTNNANCNQVRDTVLITFTNPPSINAGANISLCKNNVTTPLNGNVAGVTTTGVWIGGSGTYNPNNTTLNANYTPSASEIAAGSTTLVLQSTNNGACNQVTDTVLLQFTNAPVVNAGIDLFTCKNNINTAISGIVTGPTTTGNWTGGLGTYNPGSSVLSTTYTPTAAEIAAGSLTLTLVSTNNGNCNQEQDQVIIYFTNPATVSAGSDISTCKNNPNVALNGGVSGITTTGIWSGGTGTYTPGNSSLSTLYSPSAGEIAAGSTTLILTSTGNLNCNSVTDTVLIQFTNPATVDAGTNISLCENNAGATLNGSVSGITTTGIWIGGSGSYTPDNTTLNAAYVPSPSEIAAGTATLVLQSTNNGGCNQVMDTVLLQFTNAPAVSAGADIYTCRNNINTVISGVVTGPTTTGNWSGGLGTFNPGTSALTTTYTPSPIELAAGSVTLTLQSTNNGNCNQEQDQVIIYFSDPATVAAGNDITACRNNANVNLNGSVSGITTTGIWSGGSGTYTPGNTSLNALYTPSSSELAVGSAILVLNSTNNSGCNTVTDTITINFTNAPVVSAGPDITLCKNNVLTALNGNITGATTTGVWVGGSGTYNPSSAAVNTNYTPSASEISAGTATLVLQSTNNGNCNQVEDTVVIYFTNAPIVYSGPDITVCANNPTISVSGTVTAGTTTGIWSTSGGGSFAPSSTSLTSVYTIDPADIAQGSITIKLTSTNNGNCNAVSDSLVVNITPKPTVDAGLNDTICANNIYYPLNGLVTNGASAGIWTTLGNGVFGNPNNLSTTYTLGQADTTSGVVKLVLTSTGGNCLPETDTLQIVIAKVPLVNAGPDNMVCDNERILLNGSVIGLTTTGAWTTLGTGAFTPDDSLLTTYYQPSPLDVANGYVNLVLTSTYNKGCTAVTDTIRYTFKPSPVSDFNGNNVCAKTATSFTDTSVPSASLISSWWDFGDSNTSTANNPTHAYTNPGTYTVSHVVYSNNGCNDTVKKVIDVYFLPQAQFYNSTSCVGNSTQFVDSSKTVSGIINNWQWNFGDSQTSTIQNPQHGFATPTVYTVSLVVTSSLGCKDTIQKTVTVISGPTADFSINPNPVQSLEVVTFTDLSTGPASLTNWYWQFGDSMASNIQNPTHIYDTQGDLSVFLVVKDINGCIDTIRKDISVVLLPDVPTAFSPNGDGQNDVFLVRGGPFKTLNLRVYNNWGQLIFESNDQKEGWDGKFNGVDQPLGVYVWMVDVEMLNGKKVKKTGDVTLLR